MKLLVFFSALGLSILIQAQEKVQLADLYSEKEAIAAIENVFKSDSLGFNLRRYANAQQTISLIMSRTPSKKKVYAHYNNSFLDALEKDELKVMEKSGITYTLLGDTTGISVFFKYLIKYYASVPDTDKMHFFFMRWKELSNAYNKCWDAQITAIEQEFDDILNAPTFEDIAKGIYVTTETDKLGVPLYIISLYGIHEPVILKTPEVSVKSEKKKGHYLTIPLVEDPNYAFGELPDYDERDKTMTIKFSNRRNVKGNEALAHTMVDMGARIRSTVNVAVANAPMNTMKDVGIGFGAQVGAGIFSGLMMMGAMSAAQSRSYYHEYIFEMKATSNTTFDATLSRYSASYSSNGNEKVKEDYEGKSLTFVKWEASDSVIFISPKHKPITVGSLSKKSPLLNEYHKVRRKYNATPLYFLPGIGIYTGIPASIIFSKKRKAAWKKINTANMEILRQKADEATTQHNMNPIDK